MWSLRYSGVAHVDVRRSARDGRLRIIELNARFWQTVIASLAAGVNLPQLACRLALGEAPEPGVFRDVTFVPWRLWVKAWLAGWPLGLEHPWRLRTGLSYVARDPGAALRTAREWGRPPAGPVVGKLHRPCSVAAAHLCEWV